MFLYSGLPPLCHRVFQIKLHARFGIPENTSRTLVPFGFCPSAEVSSFMQIYVSKDGVKTNAEK